IYISPLAKNLIGQDGISGRFIGPGVLFAAVVIVAGQLLAWPPKDYVPPARTPVANAPGSPNTGAPQMTSVDWSATSMMGTVQFYALVFLFFGSAQSGLLVIGNATKILSDTAGAIEF